MADDDFQPIAPDAQARLDRAFAISMTQIDHLHALLNKAGVAHSGEMKAAMLQVLATNYLAEVTRTTKG